MKDHTQNLSNATNDETGANYLTNMVSERPNILIKRNALPILH